ncbi:hypothetical protein EV383_5859 [Pseudonocardia sediminis]|uniref:Uncharacterized protein n=1 Tax=Pseudonocardia sediminis TaxID=1397368 RepID=A0A4Q7V493_PSEST|nr:hypothetical protein EV383_5859 [Pseudonocardia sediminis]
MQTTDTRAEATQADRGEAFDVDETHIVRGLD